MSLEVSYKGRTIADLDGDADCTLKTAGRFCEGDISLALREAGAEPSGTVSITRNGTVNVRDYASANVNVPNSYSAADEGKVVKNGVLVAQTARATEINENGTYDTTENNSVTVNVSGAGAVVQPLSVTQNGTYNPPSGVDGYAPVTVNVSGGSSNPTTWQTGMAITTDFDALHVGGGYDMSLTKNNDYTVTVAWVGGGNVGAAIYWPHLVNVDDINSISVKFRATAHYSNNFPVKIGIANAIAGDTVAQTFVAYDSSLDITGDEVTLSVDLQSYTGNYYIIIRPDGVSCTLYDFAIHYAQ